MTLKDKKTSPRQKYLIGVAWPYVNAELHVGHLAGCYISADIFARFQRQKGNLVLMVSGSDCHGTPIINAAQKEGLTEEQVVDKYHKTQVELFRKLGVSFDNYTKTSRENHKEYAQKIFKELYDKGYMIEKTEDQLFDEKEGRFLPDRYVEGTCPHCKTAGARGDQCDACGKTLEPTELLDPISILSKTTPTLKPATHLYFDLGKLSDQLESWIKNQKHWRTNVKNFALGWIKEGLHETPVTRDLHWGVPVPIKGYEDKVLYVWIEAVMGYLTAAIEWARLNSGELEYEDLEETNIFVPSKDPELAKAGEKAWETFWKDPEAKIYNFLGKDNIPFHTIHWPAIILGYGHDLQLPYDVPANQYLNLSSGEKMSKSKGTFIKAADLLEEFNVDTIRYYITKVMPEFSDSAFSKEDLYTANNAELVGKLGNFINRTYAFTENNFGNKIPEGELDPEVKKQISSAFEESDKLIEEVKLSQALNRIFKLVQFANQYFDTEKPWEKVKGSEAEKHEAANVLFNSFQLISSFAVLLYPFIPDTAEKIGKSLNLEVSKSRVFSDLNPGIKFENPGLLFEKLEKK